MSLRTFAKQLKPHARVTGAAVLTLVQSLGYLGCAHVPEAKGTPAREVQTLVQEGLRPFRISATQEGAIKIEKDSRSASFVYHESTNGAEVGVWQGVGRAAPVGQPPRLNREEYTEMMFILEGGVTLAEANGVELSLKAGDAVVVPRGVPYYWRLPEGAWVKKVDVILDRSKIATPLPYAHLIRLEPNGPSGVGLEEVEGFSRGHTYYESPEGGSAGVWQTQPYTGSAGFVPKQYSELMIFLEGEGALKLSDGGVVPFRAGDVLLVPRGASYQWKSQAVRKYWVAFDPR
jgi:uncharacterized cupin superfamily protein